MILRNKKYTRKSYYRKTIINNKALLFYKV